METFIRFSLGIVLIQHIFGLPVSNLTVANLDVSIESKVKESTSSYSTVPSVDCNFVTENNDISTEISSRINDDTRLLVFNLTFYGWSGNILNFYKGNLYKPTQWVLALGHSGRSLLYLDDNFELLSLWTLTINKQTMNISLKESSPNCTEEINATTFENIVRELLFTNFRGIKAGDAICNEDIIDNHGYAKFIYKCCDRNLDGTIECEVLSNDYVISLLFAIMVIITLYVMLNFPSFVPEILYRYEQNESYKHITESKQFNVLLTKEINTYQAIKTVNKSRLENMKSFKQTIKKMKHNVLYKLKLKNVHIKVKDRCLIHEREAPVGLLSSFKDLFVMCKIRKLPSVSKCCHANICSPWVSKCCACRFRWYDLLSKVMIFITYFILMSPLILRIVLYYCYEKNEIDTQRDASSRVGLMFSEPIYELLNRKTSLSLIVFPLLPCMFLVGFICSEKYIRQVWFKCIQYSFRAVRERNISERLGDLVSWLLKPCEMHGFLCVCLAILYIAAIPIFFFISLAYLPLVYFQYRFITSFYLEWFETVANHQNLKRRQIINAIFQFISLIVFINYISYILMLLIPYYVKMAVYTTIGVILNVSTVFTYISVAFILAMYAKGRLKHIEDRYLFFNKTIYDVLQTFYKNLDTGTITNVQVNQKKKVAVTIKSNGKQCEEDNPPPTFWTTEYGKLRWRTYGLFLISENNLVRISEKFFFDACKIEHYCCPGELLSNFIRAFYQLLAILVYLLVVVLVVLAFEESYNLSPTSKFLVTLAGSFLPWMFKTVIRTDVPLKTDKSNMNLTISFNDYLDKYREDWPIDDIVVEMSNDTENYEGINGLETDIDAPLMQRLSLNSLAINTDAITPVEQNRIDLLINDDTEPYYGIYESEMDINVPLLQC